MLSASSPVTEAGQLRCGSDSSHLFFLIPKHMLRPSNSVSLNDVSVHLLILLVMETQLSLHWVPRTHIQKPGITAHACDPGTGETEPGGAHWPGSLLNWWGQVRETLTQSLHSGETEAGTHWYLPLNTHAQTRTCTQLLQIGSKHTKGTEVAKEGTWQ